MDHEIQFSQNLSVLQDGIQVIRSCAFLDSYHRRQLLLNIRHVHVSAATVEREEWKSDAATVFNPLHLSESFEATFWSVKTYFPKCRRLDMHVLLGRYRCHEQVTAASRWSRPPNGTLSSLKLPYFGGSNGSAQSCLEKTRAPSRRSAPLRACCALHYKEVLLPTLSKTRRARDIVRETMSKRTTCRSGSLS